MKSHKYFERERERERERGHHHSQHDTQHNDTQNTNKKTRHSAVCRCCYAACSVFIVMLSVMAPQSPTHYYSKLMPYPK